MRDDVRQYVSVAHDSEIETPGTSDAGLPLVPGFVKFLRPQGRVAEVLKQQYSCLSKAVGSLSTLYCRPARNGRFAGVSLGQAFSFPGGELGGFLVKVGDELAVVRKSF